MKNIKNDKCKEKMVRKIVKDVIVVYDSLSEFLNFCFNYGIKPNPKRS